MFNRFIVMSLYDMERLEVGNVVAAAAYLNAVASEYSMYAKMIRQGLVPPTGLSEHTRIWTLKSIERVRDFARAWQIAALERSAMRAFDMAPPLLAAPVAGATALEDLNRQCALLSQLTIDELSGRKLYTLDRRHASWFENPSPFGDKVEDAFPSAVFDIEEAAKCRALGRWTASVMHLMRVLETGLAALAQHYGVEKQANWNQTLNQIEASTREVGKRTHGAEAEQWAAEAAAHLRFVKNAWRNHAMHPSEKYDEQHAVAIFDNCRGFMSHLAEKLTEDAPRTPW